MYRMQRLIARIYTLLGKPKQEQLYYEDVRDQLNALIMGYVQDMDLGNRSQRTQVEEIQITPDDVDYTISLANVPDFEAEGLEYSPSFATIGVDRAWYEAKLVPLQSFSAHARGGYIAASIYGSSALAEGQKLRLNIPSEMVSRASWRLLYRLPLLTLVQMGERAPIPTNFMPMLEYHGAIVCSAIVQNESPAWERWKDKNIPLYMNELRSWTNEEGTGRWQVYLDSSAEDPIQPIQPFDDFRRGGGRAHRNEYLPIQGD